jgi:hypothetical protein
MAYIFEDEGGGEEEGNDDDSINFSKMHSL